MNDRASQILNLLIKNPDYKVSNIERLLDLTRRQVNYSLSQINNDLVQNNLPKITKNADGSIVVPKETLQFYSQRSSDAATEFYSEKERIDIICLFLAVSHDDVSLNHLMDVLKVSKNTIVNDIKQANESINEYGLSIKYNRIQGYDITGNEFQIRTLIEDIIQRNITYKRDFSILDRYFKFRKDKAIHLISEVEKELFVNYSDESFDFMANVFTYVFYRIKNKHIHLNDKIGKLVKSSKEYEVIQKLLRDENLRKDSEWISLMFMASNVYVSEKSDLILVESDLFSLVHQMVEHFKQLTLIEIEDQGKFEVRLFNHLRPACFRIMFDIKIHDYYSGLVNSDYDVVKQIIGDLIKPIEEYIGKRFSNDELELLTLYFGSQLRQEQDIAPKARAVVVCSNGLIVSRMMLETLRGVFPEIHFLTSLSIREFEKFGSDYDIVFTTDPIQTNINQYIINPIMSKDEQTRLRDRVLSDLGITSPEKRIKELMRTIEKYAKVENMQALKDELEVLLQTSSKIQMKDKDTLPGLMHYLHQDWVQITNKEFDWRDAIRYAFEPMRKVKAINDQYIDKTMQSFDNQLSYSFFGTEAAIPHADEKTLIYEEFIGFTVFQKPIQFPNGNLVHVIAPIAILNTSKHIYAVKKLAEIVMSKENIDWIIGFTNESALYQAFIERDWL